MTYQLNKISVFKGRPEQIPLVLVDESGRPLATSGLQSIKIYLRKEDLSLLEKEADTGMSWGYGEPCQIYVFNLTAEQTALLKVGENQSAYAKLTFATTEMRYRFRSFLTVLEEVF